MMKKKVVIISGLLVAALGVGAALVAWSGVYNVAATRGHLALTQWLLQTGMERSVETHASGIKVPPLDDPALVRRGLGHYHGGCAPCHGAPSQPRSPIALHMLPEPPYLPSRTQQWSANELFWIIKNGIKYTGMPGWAAQQRDDEVWAVVAFLQRLPELSAEEYRHLILGEADAVRREIENDNRFLAFAGPVGDDLAACARCHGLRGAGDGTGAFPRLAGQGADYLYTALRSYAVGSRPSGIMQPVAAALTDTEMRRLAGYYAANGDAPYPSESPAGATDPLLPLGARLATVGLPTDGIPACNTCHDPSGRTANPLFPSLAGQYANYTALQLRLWQADARGRTPTSQIMAAVARRLTDEQIDAVAFYYAFLRRSDAETAAAARSADDKGASTAPAVGR